jgi:hypothetical protein
LILPEHSGSVSSLLEKLNNEEEVRRLPCHLA